MAGPSSGGSPRVTGIVLAAGRSERFGNSPPKQLFPVDGRPLVSRTVHTALASKLRQVVVVVGHRAPEVAAVLAGHAVEVVVNERFARGQSSSVRAGLERIEREAEAAIFIPADLPHLDSSVLDRLIDAYSESGASIVVPVVASGRRAPVLLDRRLFPEIASISKDEGARQLFPKYRDEILEVEFDSARIFDDLDA